MNRSRRSREAGIWLLESMLAVAIFSLGILALASAVNNCLIAQRIKEEDLRARLALHNRMVEIESGSVLVRENTTEDLKGAFEGMTMRTRRTPLERKNEDKQDITGLVVVTLEVAWETQREKMSRELSFYVLPRQ